MKSQSANEYLNERLKDIFINGTTLQWNINKTDKEWKSRIKQRTNLSNDSFYELIQLGIDKTYKNFCDIGDTCILFQKSKFILIINKQENRIITIRDAKWDKPLNSKSCKRLMVFESEDTIKDIIDNVNFNEVNFNGYSYYMTNNQLVLEVNYECNCCIEINL